MANNVPFGCDTPSVESRKPVSIGTMWLNCKSDRFDQK